MRHTGIGEIERGVHLPGGHGWIHRIDAHGPAHCTLIYHAAVIFVGFLLNMPEIQRLLALVLQAFLVAGQFDGLRFRLFIGQENGLRHVGDVLYLLAGLDAARQFQHGAFAHAVHYHVYGGVKQERGSQTVLPVVVMRHAAQ